jgi:hypothetical protein
MDEGGGASRTTDPAAGSSAATDVSLREYVALMIKGVEERADIKFTAMQDAVASAFANSQRAIDKADEATEKRFEGVNEFRAALSDQATRFVTSETLAAMDEKLQASIQRNRDDLSALGRRMDLREGQSTGTRLTTGVIVTVTTIAIALIGLIVVLANYLAR